MRISIKHKISAALFISTFILTFAINAFQQFLNYRDFRAHLEADANAAVKLAVDEANLWFQKNLTAANLLGLETERRAQSPDHLEADFREIASKLEIDHAYLGMNSGTWVGKKDFRQAVWYRRAKESGQPFFIGPYTGKTGGRYVLSFVAPLFDSSRTLVFGAVGFDQPFENLQKAISRIFINEVEELKVFPVKDGKFVVFVRVKDMNAADFEALSARVGDENFLNASTARAGGHEYLSVYQPIADTAMWIYYPISLSRLVEPAIWRAVWVSGLSAAGLFLVFQIALFLVGRYIRRIQELSQSTQAVAAGNFSVRIPKGPDDEIGDLALAFNKMSEALIHYIEALKISVASKERLRRELELAAEIQKNALPEFIPIIHGAELSAKSLPAYEVGGDYYDFLTPDPGHLGIVIADAAGKGISGTLFMTNSRSVFRVIAKEEKAPETLLLKMNDFIASNSASGMFITLLYSVYNAKTRVLTTANAGHYAPLIFRPSSGEFLTMNNTGLPIGIMAGEVYVSDRTQLEPGDVLTFFTDGVVEAANAAKEMFGVERMMEIIRKNASGGANDISKKIEDTWKKFASGDQQFDDMTLLVMKIT